MLMNINDTPNYRLELMAHLANFLSALSLA